MTLTGIFLRVWKASSAFRPILAFCEEFNDSSARFSGILLMDSVWDLSMDTEQLSCCVFIFADHNPNTAFHYVTIFLLTAYLHDSTYDVRLSIWLRTAISRFSRALAGLSAWSNTAMVTCSSHDSSTYCSSAATLLFSLTCIRLRHLKTRNHVSK